MEIFIECLGGWFAGAGGVGGGCAEGDVGVAAVRGFDECDDPDRAACGEAGERGGAGAARGHAVAGVCAVFPAFEAGWAAGEGG